MALHDFLVAHRSEILDLTRQRIVGDVKKGRGEEILESLPELMDDIVAALRNDVGLPRETEETDSGKSAARHGLQRLRLGFTITELVHDYGAICNAVTTAAEKDGAITAHEYQVLNQVLDDAIADAVSEYSGHREREHDREMDERANAHLGFVAHELRNAISAAILAFDAIRRGQVGVGGRTSDILERNLMRLRGLIDRSLTEVRLKSELALDSPNGAEIELRCMPSPEPSRGVRIEVADACGGLRENTIDELFDPFVRGRADGGGLGLGLAITRQAVEAHGGRVHVRNLPGKGCVFVIDLPPNA